MAHEPFESWKRSPPASPREAGAAELLKQVGDPETLSPQALNRVEHQLRAAGKSRASVMGMLWLGLTAAGGLAVVLAMVATIRFMDSQASLAASAAQARRTLALNDRKPPEVAPEPAEQVDEAVRRAPAQVGALPMERLRSRGLDASKKAAGKANGLVAAKVEVATAPGATARASAAGAPAEEAAAALPAPVLQDARQRKADGEPAASVERELECQGQISEATATLEGGSGDLEHALFIRGSCRLRLGQRSAGIKDFRESLARFPGGRFASVIRARLRDLEAH